MNKRSDELKKLLSLEPHPEGGFYREIYRSELDVIFSGKNRTSMTSIFFLLTAKGVSRWHNVDADEAWHYYEGDPVELLVMPPDFSCCETVLLGRAHDGCTPAHVVPAGWWQAAKCSGEYSLCGCTVAPGFEFSGFRFLSDEEKEKVKKVVAGNAELL